MIGWEIIKVGPNIKWSRPNGRLDGPNGRPNGRPDGPNGRPNGRLDGPNGRQKQNKTKQNMYICIYGGNIRGNIRGIQNFEFWKLG